MMNPFISIIIPTYNRAHLISETLDSIIAQIYTNWECIIVDDGSNDETELVLSIYQKSDKRFKFYKRPLDKVKGPNSCRNYGFEKSNGLYVKWFDSDDIMMNTCLSNINELFLKKECDLVVSDIEYINLTAEKIVKKHNYKSNDLLKDYILGNITFFTFIPTWNRKFLEKQTQLFDETIRNLDDWDFNLRMLYQNPKIEYIDIPLIQYRVHAESLSHEIGKMNFEEIQSELFAREKHVKLISENKKADPTILKNLIKERCKYFFREALIQKEEKRYYYLKILLQKQFGLRDYFGIIKTLFGVVVFSVFNKGYKILK